LIGRLLAHYEITAELGKGGMGEVFRARDTKLDREVALKVLPTEMSSDPERKLRFEREARSLATLQHPNVASIYGFEEFEGQRFLVMELVEGEDLSQRFSRGAVPATEARSIAMQIAAGLEAAHDSGLVHRDLKPANVMVSAVGDVKILDFGLARAWYGDIEDDSNPALSPTITAAMTQAGTILGTAAYMSPEQARGRKVDRRSDIWAFGVILYEMLSGTKLFEGDTISDTMAAVLRAEPDFSLLPTDDAPELCHLAERCLQRDARQRLRDIGEARLLLEPGGAALSSMGMSAAMIAAPARRRNPMALVIVALLCLAAGAAGGMFLLGGSEPAPVIHAMIPPPPEHEFDLGGSSPGPAVISPDGLMIAFVAANRDGETKLWLRHVDSAEAVMLSGTDDAAYPFWSPDSKSIAFFDVDEGRLRKVAANGGPPTTLCAASNGKGGSWNHTGEIIFAPSAGDGLHKVSATGGDPEQITTLEEGVGSHRHPRFLPDQVHYVFLARNAGSVDGEQSIQLGILGSVERREIAKSLSNAEYSAGHLLTVREHVLMATPFPAPFEELTGGATPLVENIAVLGQGSAIGIFSATREGILVYQTGESSLERILSWTSRETGASGSIGDTGSIYFPKISPDGRRAIVEMRGDHEEGTDLWLVELESGLRTRFTFAEGDETHALWTPDGSAVIYTRTSEGKFTIMRQPVEGTASAQTLCEGASAMLSTGISPDGEILLMRFDVEGKKQNVYKLAINAGTEPEPLIETDKIESGAVWSPDGKWIAYHAESSNRFDIYVAPADGAGRKWQLSRMGTVWPAWSEDGSKLYCVTFDGALFEYDVDGSGETFNIGASRQVARTLVPSSEGIPYALHPDGDRVLQGGEDVGAESSISLLHMVTDWQRGLAR